MDSPPEVTYHCRTTVYTANGEEVPDIKEEDEDQQAYHTGNNNFITHHNTHQESEQISQGYSAQLQDLDEDQYYDEVDQVHELQYSLLVTPHDWPERPYTHKTQHQLPA